MNIPQSQFPQAGIGPSQPKHTHVRHVHEKRAVQELTTAAAAVAAGASVRTARSAVFVAAAAAAAFPLLVKRDGAGQVKSVK